MIGCFYLCSSEESIYCYTPHNFTRDQALYARGYCWTDLRDALPGVESHLWPSLFEHKFLPYALLAFAGIMYIPALGWEFLASTRLTSELNFLLQEIDNCYHRAAEGRAPKIEKQIQSKGPGITERERREIIENAEKEKSPEQNLFEKYLERRGQSNFLAKLYLARHLAIICLSSIPISYLSAYYARQRQNEFTCALGEPPDISSYAELKLRVNCKLPAVQLQRIMAAVDIALLCTMNLIILVNLLHLFVVRKSNFVFDKLHKVGIKTRRRWQKSQFCDINILAMFCNENRDHIKSLNRLDFITNESDLMYDNVVRQLLAALAQSNHDCTPTVRDSGIQTLDPNMDLGVGEMGGEPLVIKRPRKKIKWIPSSNPLPQPFKVRQLPENNFHVSSCKSSSFQPSFNLLSSRNRIILTTITCSLEHSSSYQQGLYVCILPTELYQLLRRASFCERHRKWSSFRTPKYETLKCLFNCCSSYDLLTCSWGFFVHCKGTPYPDTSGK